MPDKADSRIQLKRYTQGQSRAENDSSVGLVPFAHLPACPRARDSPRTLGVVQSCCCCCCCLHAVCFLCSRLCVLSAVPEDGALRSRHPRGCLDWMSMPDRADGWRIHTWTKQPWPFPFGFGAVQHQHRTPARSYYCSSRTHSPTLACETRTGLSVLLSAASAAVFFFLFRFCVEMLCSTVPKDGELIPRHERGSLEGVSMPDKADSRIHNNGEHSNLPPTPKLLQLPESQVALFPVSL